MQENEAKFCIQDIPRMRMRLLQLEARLIHDRTFETNLRFDQPDGELRAEGRVLRLRRDSETRLTYKGAGENHHGILSRIEIEIVTDDFEKAKLLLVALGYQAVFEYEKYRTTFAVDGLHIMLDEVPIGNFIEIEGEDMESIRALADRLDLDWSAAIPAGYHLLFTRVCAVRTCLDPTQLTFRALNGIAVQPDELFIKVADRPH
jgi:adenylate cyclase, class 2